MYMGSNIRRAGSKLCSAIFSKKEIRRMKDLVFLSFSLQLMLHLLLIFRKVFVTLPIACDRAPESGILEVNVGLGAKRYCISLKVGHPFVNQLLWLVAS